MQLIKRDIPDWQTKPHQPRNAENWFKVYKKLKKEAQAEMDEGADKLKAALEGIKSEREQSLAQLVTRNDPRGPSRRQKLNYNYQSGKAGSKGGSKISLMEKLKREARDARNARMTIPTHELKKQQTTITKAPQALLDDHRKLAAQAMPKVPLKTPQAPRPPITHQQDPSSDPDRSRQIREARLKALKEDRRIAYDALPSAECFSACFLESSSSHPSICPPRPRTASPARMTSSKPVLKRKEAPNIFMSSKKPKVQEQTLVAESRL